MLHSFVGFCTPIQKVLLKTTLYSFQRRAALLCARWLCRTMSLHARNHAVLRKEGHVRWKILLHKAYIGGYRFDSVICSILYFWLSCISSHGFKKLSGRILKHGENHRNIHTLLMFMRGGWVEMVSDLTFILASVCFAYQPNFTTMQYLVEPTVATRTGCWYASQQCLKKTRQAN